ncbi:MAG: hypothetical protein CMQ70_01290 [Gammaproteobacteria bacterium]|nr:hypothetical protein [Gammaproteobacteria bacterium]|tara:strand:+ start:952 stop:2271 length:1320 start_codon:yes stop_codon:yes gene_type:complete
MKENQIQNYIYEDNYICFKSYINDFSSKLYEEFNLKAKETKLKSKIEDLLNGGHVNKTENQAAWHPKYRKDGPKKNNLLQNLIKDLTKDNNSLKINIIIIGIGGSYEGPKLLIESIRPAEINKELNIQFITGSDQAEFFYKTSSLNPKETIFVISSKSFTTDETIEMLNVAKFWSKSSHNFIAITSNPSEAKQHGFEEQNIISFDKEIGGRYSIWSQVGETPLLDKDCYKLFIDGGKLADNLILKDKKYLHFLKRLSFTDIWLHNHKQKNVRVLLSYIWSLRSLPDYFQQLEMESLGKKANPKREFNKTGQIIFGGYGPTAQHSYFQLLHQGTHEICADIILTTKDQKSLAFAQAITQSKLLSIGADVIEEKEKEKINSNVPVNLFMLKETDPFTIGYLIASWEYRTYITSVMLGINPFDQFGVAAGKIYTRSYLRKNN